MGKYRYHWSANNGSSYGYSKCVYTNKRRAAKDARDICEGEVFDSSAGSWIVFDQNGKEVLSGMIQR